jgi:hypothetical protein
MLDLNPCFGAITGAFGFPRVVLARASFMIAAGEAKSRKITTPEAI